MVLGPGTARGTATATGLRAGRPRRWDDRHDRPGRLSGAATTAHRTDRARPAGRPGARHGHRPGPPAGRPATRAARAATDRPRHGPPRPAPLARPPPARGRPGGSRPAARPGARIDDRGSRGPRPTGRPRPRRPEADLADDEELIAGRRPVEEAFVARRPARRLLVVPQRRQALERLVLHATSLRIPVVEVEGGTLTAIAGFDGHQGIALVVEPRTYAGLDDSSPGRSSVASRPSSSSSTRSRIRRTSGRCSGAPKRPASTA